MWKTKSLSADEPIGLRVCPIEAASNAPSQVGQTRTYLRTGSVVTCTCPSPLIRFRTMVQGPRSGLSMAQKANWPPPLFSHAFSELPAPLLPKAEKENAFLLVPLSSAFIATRRDVIPSRASIVSRASGFVSLRLNTLTAGALREPSQSGRPHMADDRRPSPA